MDSAIKRPVDALLTSAVAGVSTWQWHRDGSRYAYDHHLLARGWSQWDTEQDAWYFGVWVNRLTREVFCYCEGDCIHTVCETDDAFRLELARMVAHYGKPPPAMIELDFATGTRTEVYGTRLSPEDV